MKESKIKNVAYGTYSSRVFHFSTRQALVKLDASQRCSREWKKQRSIHHQMLQVRGFHLKRERANDKLSLTVLQQCHACR